MATPKALNALQKTKEALDDIKSKLEPVIQRLRDDAFERATAQAQATVSLSIGMMKYMGARLQGLDQGRKSDDPLRKELNQMRNVLAEIRARYSEETKETLVQSNPGDNRTSDKKKPSIAKRLLTKRKLNEESELSATNNGETTDMQAGNTDNHNQRANNKRHADNSKRRTKRRK